MATVTTSKQFTLGLRDFLRGLLTAIASSVVPVLMEWSNALQTGAEFNFEPKKILGFAISGGIGYLIVNFLSPSKVIAVTGKGEKTLENAKSVERFL